MVASELVKFSETPGLEKEYLEPFQAQAWSEYVTKTLNPTKERDSKPLGGHRPVNPTEMDPLAGSTLNNSTDELSSANDQFSRFLTHQMTADMPDKFGAVMNDDDDDDFNDMDTDFDHSAIAFNPFDSHRDKGLNEEDKNFYHQKGFADFSAFEH